MNLILGIESTCDETSCAIVRNGTEILSNIVSSQIDLHKIYGGVVPELAARQHVDVIIPVIQAALTQANVELEDIDAFTAAKGPGLIGALLIGLNAAKALSFSQHKPFVATNHVEAHIYAAMMPVLNKVTFPSLGVVISGGHTFLIKMSGIGDYELIGTTIDDAIGEVFDKVAKIMGLPYPGGPEIEKISKEGDSQRYDFKPGHVKNSPFNFSFSGLKTKVLYTVKGQSAQISSPIIINEEDIKDVAASFQRVAFQDLINKIKKACKKYNFNQIFFGGGVSNNRYLRNVMHENFDNIDIFWPTAALSLDNAAMLAGLAYHKLKNKPNGDSLDVEALSRIPLENNKQVQF